MNQNGTACSHDKNHDVTNEESCDCMQQAWRGSYLVVGVALRIEGGERRDWNFVQPLSLWVTPRLVIKRNFRRIYLRRTDKAQHGATHKHTHAHTAAVY